MPLFAQNLVEAKNRREGVALVVLLELEYAPGEFIRWAALNEDLEDGPIVFDGHTYVPFRFRKPKTSQNSRAEISTFTFTVASPDQLFASVLAHHIIEGKEGRFIRVDRDHLDDPTAKVEERFTVEMVSDVTDAAINVTCKGMRFSPRGGVIPSQTMTRREYPGLSGASRARFY